MVFCASLVPCASASRPPEITWPKRKPPVTGPGRSRPTIRYSSRIASPATTKARIGATTAGTITLPRIPSSKDTALGPSATSTAPTIPPIRAWEELDGRPKYQVVRFQAIAPTRPANTAKSPIAAGSTTSFAIVAATWSEMKAPTKLSTAA